jgi:hypothetical protein
LDGAGTAVSKRPSTSVGAQSVSASAGAVAGASAGVGSAGAAYIAVPMKASRRAARGKRINREYEDMRFLHEVLSGWRRQLD